MTRSKLRSTLRRVYLFLFVVLAFALVAKLADKVPGLRGSPLEATLKDAYEFVRDMALLIATGGVAHITNVFQHRSSFVSALREEWREIIEAKSALFTFTQMEHPTLDQYLATFCKLSETIDNMRTVYRNVGETEELIGLYPYAPLHDMRRALQTLDPRENAMPTAEQRKLVRDSVLQAFYAVREGFLEELDLEAPDRPILTFGARRMKKPGSARAATRAQGREGEMLDRFAPRDARIGDFLAALYQKEQSTAKPWRQITTADATAPANGDARPAA